VVRGPWSCAPPPLKVLHVIPSLSPTQGGPSFALPLMERALTQAGVEVTVATTDDNGPRTRLSVPLGQPQTTNGATRYYFRKQTEFYKCSVPLWRWLGRRVGEFDLVHVHALFSFTSLAAARCARRRRVPYVIRPLGVLNRWGMENRRALLKSLSFRLIETPMLRRAAAMHYTSEQERIEAEAAGATARPFVVPLGLDLRPLQTLPGPDRFFKRWPQAMDRAVVLFLSRIDPKKGLDLLIDAFAAVKKRHADAALVIAGNGEESFVRGLRERAERVGIAGDVVWAGFLDGADKLAALAAARVFVLPSHSENFGIALVEALAAGLPCITTEGVAVSADVRECNAGLVVPAESSALAVALDRLLSDGDLRARLGGNARRLAIERFSLEAMGAALKRLYENVLDE
jgi:glycosyltransferase involved in cell wall biosynthesis